jgi:hypothetical protein
LIDQKTEEKQQKNLTGAWAFGGAPRKTQQRASIVSKKYGVRAIWDAHDICLLPKYNFV